MDTLDRAGLARRPHAHTSAADILSDGLYSGLIGAFLVAVWFLVLDLASGRPLFTPNLLGSWLMGVRPPLEVSPVDPGTVAAYTAVHVIAFVAFGTMVAYLVSLFEHQHPAAGIALLFLFVFFEVGVLIFAAALGGDVLGRLGAWTVAVANLLAAAGMAGYFWSTHPRMRENVAHIWDD